MNEKASTLQLIKDTMRRFYRGEREEAAAAFAAMWEELGESGDPYQRCVLAHYIADTQQDKQQELAWDLKALEAAKSLSDDSPSAAAVRVFLPSLHLNLADDYRRLGDFEKARTHIDAGGEVSGVLGLDAYGQTVRAGLVRVEAQITDHDSGPGMIFDFD